MQNLIRYFINLFDKISNRKVINELKKYFINDINVFFDVGGHHGETTIWFSKFFKIKKIYIFEPNFDSFNILKKKISKINKKFTIKIYNFALGNENKEADLKQMIESSSSTFHDLDENSQYYKRKKKILTLFFDKKLFNEKRAQIVNFVDFIKEEKVDYIDLLKIDTEGYELNVLKGLNDSIKKTKLIYFEHHFDLMIKKGYKFNDINQLLMQNGFKQVFKNKMVFRRSFEYIYINSSIKG